MLRRAQCSRQDGVRSMSTPALDFDEARRTVCLEAAYEIEALAEVLPGLVSSGGSDNMHRIVRGISARLLSLSGVIMSGIGDESESTKKLQRRVSGGAA